MDARLRAWGTWGWVAEGEVSLPAAGEVWNGAGAFGPVGQEVQGTRVDAPSGRVAAGEVYGDPGAPLVGTYQLTGAPTGVLAAGLLNAECRVEVKSAGAVNALGEAGIAWTAGAPLRCRVEGLAGRSGFEVTRGKQVVKAEWRVWLAGGAAVREVDRIRVTGGALLEVLLVRRGAGGVGAAGGGGGYVEVWCVEGRV